MEKKEETYVVEEPASIRDVALAKFADCPKCGVPVAVIATADEVNFVHSVIWKIRKRKKTHREVEKWKILNMKCKQVR